MIAYAGKGHERGSSTYGESSGKSSPHKSTRSVSCGYELKLCVYTIFMLWTCNAKGYINGMKAV